MDAIILEAKTREAGKHATRAARRQKEVPCVLYGHDLSNVLFQVPELNLNKLVYTDELHTIDLKIEEQIWNCILKHVDFHPVTDRPLHADFQLLRMGEMITLMVPIQFIGTPIGQKEGGETQQVMNEIEVTCLPKDIPQHIEVDISGLDMGDAIHVGALAVEGLIFSDADDQTVVMVVAPRLEEEVEEEEGLELEEGEELEEDEDA